MRAFLEALVIFCNPDYIFPLSLLVFYFFDSEWDAPKDLKQLRQTDPIQLTTPSLHQLLKTIKVEYPCGNQKHNRIFSSNF